MKERKGKIHTEEVEERNYLGLGLIGNKHCREKGGKDILVPNPLVLKARRSETPEHSAS